MHGRDGPQAKVARRSSTARRQRDLGDDATVTRHQERQSRFWVSYELTYPPLSAADVAVVMPFC